MIRPIYYWGAALFLILIIGATALFVVNHKREMHQMQQELQAAQALEKKQAAQQKHHPASPGFTAKQLTTQETTENITTSKTHNVTADKTTQPAPVPVSPHGFGPYPPLPPSWTETPEEIWGNCVDPDHELLKRVRIKLLSQGVDVLGGYLDPDNGKVYPSIPGIVYAEWEDYEGSKYLAGISGCPASVDRLSAIANAKFSRGEDDSLYEADVPADIQLISYEEAGIDPYQFLGLTRP